MSSFSTVVQYSIGPRYNPRQSLSIIKMLLMITSQKNKILNCKKRSPNVLLASINPSRLWGFYFIFLSGCFVTFHTEKFIHIVSQYCCFSWNTCFSACFQHSLLNIPLCIIVPSPAPLQGQNSADNCIFDPLSDCPRVALFESQVALAGSGDAGRLDRHLHLLLPRPRQLLHRLLHIRCLRHGAIPQVKD